MAVGPVNDTQKEKDTNMGVSFSPAVQYYAMLSLAFIGTFLQSALETADRQIGCCDKVPSYM